MENRSAFLYLKSFDMTQFDRLTLALQQVGFELLKPDTKTITAVRGEADITTEDDLVGDYIAVSGEWIAGRIRDRVQTNLKWWTEEWFDIFFALTFFDDGVELEFDLGSVTNNIYEQPIITMLTTQFQTAVTNGNALGLVVDPDAMTDEFDWSSFFFGPARFKDDLPRILAVPIQKLGQVFAKTGQARKETVQEFIIFYTDYKSAD